MQATARSEMGKMNVEFQFFLNTFRFIFLHYPRSKKYIVFNDDFVIVFQNLFATIFLFNTLIDIFTSISLVISIRFTRTSTNKRSSKFATNFLKKFTRLLSIPSLPQLPLSSWHCELYS